MRATLALSLVTALSLATPTASADQTEALPSPSAPLPDRPASAAQTSTLPHAPKNAISLEVFSLLNSGVTLQYERFLGPPRVSLATSLGVRSSGGTDLDVLDTSFGVEGRIWFIGRAPFTKFRERAMVGPYMGVRLDYGITRVSDDTHTLGTEMRVAEGLMLGARIAIAEHFELTPAIGTGLRTEFDPRGRLAPWTRWEILRVGLTAGVMF